MTDRSSSIPLADRPLPHGVGTFPIPREEVRILNRVSLANLVANQPHLQPSEYSRLTAKQWDALATTPIYAYQDKYGPWMEAAAERLLKQAKGETNRRLPEIMELVLPSRLDRDGWYVLLSNAPTDVLEILLVATVPDMTAEDVPPSLRKLCGGVSLGDHRLIVAGQILRTDHFYHDRLLATLIGPGDLLVEPSYAPLNCDMATTGMDYRTIHYHLVRSSTLAMLAGEWNLDGDEEDGDGSGDDYDDDGEGDLPDEEDDIDGRCLGYQLDVGVLAKSVASGDHITTPFTVSLSNKVAHLRRLIYWGDSLVDTFLAPLLVRFAPYTPTEIMALVYAMAVPATAVSYDASRWAGMAPDGVTQLANFMCSLPPSSKGLAVLLALLRLNKLALYDEGVEVLPKTMSDMYRAQAQRKAHIETLATAINIRVAHAGYGDQVVAGLINRIRDHVIDHHNAAKSTTIIELAHDLCERRDHRLAHNVIKVALGAGTFPLRTDEDRHNTISQVAQLFSEAVRGQLGGVTLDLLACLLVVGITEISMLLTDVPPPNNGRQLPHTVRKADGCDYLMADVTVANLIHWVVQRDKGQAQR